MGISVILQDESCNGISEYVCDTEGVIAPLLPDLNDNTYSCLRFIDPYGDTIFNPLQANVMAEEWDRLKSSFSDCNAETLWADVRNLIIRCSSEPHVYLRFIGD